MWIFSQLFCWFGFYWDFVWGLLFIFEDKILVLFVFIGEVFSFCVVIVRMLVQVIGCIIFCMFVFGYICKIMMKVLYFVIVGRVFWNVGVFFIVEVIFELNYWCVNVWVFNFRFFVYLVNVFYYIVYFDVSDVVCVFYIYVEVDGFFVVYKNFDDFEMK